jgi:arylsulfatase A-like enzyme
VNNIFFGQEGVRAHIGPVTLLALIMAGLIFILFLVKNRLNSQFNYVNDVYKYSILPLVILSFILVAGRAGATGIAKLTASKEYTKVEPKKKINVFLLLFDAMGSRHLSLYGYGCDTTPYIRKFANESYVFKNAHASFVSTFISTGALYTGKYPLNNSKFYYSHDKKIKKENVFELLKQNGYNTTAVTFQNIPSLGKHGIQKSLTYPEIQLVAYKHIQLFESILTKYLGISNANIFLTLGYDTKAVFDYLIGYSSPFYAPAETFDVTNTMLNNISEPFFAYIYFFQPHPPNDIIHPFSGKLGSSKCSYLGAPTSGYDAVEMAKYDESILNIDYNFENFIENLKKRGIYKNSIIIITADHGRLWVKSKSLFAEESIAIPLIIHVPGQNKEVDIEDNVSNVDISPTILGLLDLAAPHWMDGTPLVNPAKDKTTTQHYTYSITFEPKTDTSGNFLINKESRIALCFGDYKFVYNVFDKNMQVYNLKKDPFEVEDVAGANPIVTKKMVSLLEDRIMSNKTFVKSEQGSSE